MRTLLLQVLSVQPAPAEPAFVFRLQVSCTEADAPVDSVRLLAQMHLQPARRRYSATEQAALEDLFGTPERWGTTVRPIYWTNVQTQGSGFHGETEIDLNVPWPGDANAAATRYLCALREGEIPVELLFSGTLFYRTGADLQVAFLPWSLETACRIPLETWREVRARAGRSGRTGMCAVRAGLPWEQMLQDVIAAAKEEEP